MLLRVGVVVMSVSWVALIVVLAVYQLTRVEEVVIYPPLLGLVLGLLITGGSGPGARRPAIPAALASAVLILLAGLIATTTEQTTTALTTAVLVGLGGGIATLLAATRHGTRTTT